MNDSRWTWRSVSLISIATTLVLIAGFVYAVNDVLRPSGDVPLTALPQETPAPSSEESQQFRIVALGDSLAKGTGDNTGSGYVRNTVTGLTAGGESARLLGNLGINGLTTDGLEDRLKEPGVQYALRQANVILLSIGGNDLFRGADLMGSTGGSSTSGTRTGTAAGTGKNAGTAGSTDSQASRDTSGAGSGDISPESLIAALPEASDRLGKILDTISKINPQAKLYYIGLYNPFGDIPKMLVPGNQAVTAWNNAAMDVINRHSNMTLVPTFDLFNSHLDKYLSSDHFHPNSDGYRRIAERVVQAIH